MSESNSFNAKDELCVGDKRYTIFSLPKAEAAGLAGVSKLPYSLQVLLENSLRHEDGEIVGRQSIEAFPPGWQRRRTRPRSASSRPVS